MIGVFGCVSIYKAPAGNFGGRISGAILQGVSPGSVALDYITNGVEDPQDSLDFILYRPQAVADPAK